jgi:hypothetical protein
MVIDPVGAAQVVGDCPAAVGAAGVAGISFIVTLITLDLLKF